MTVEELAKRFVFLANKALLSKTEQEEARNLMRKLKEQGMGNDEIAKLSQGKWASSTVKGYTKSIKANTPNEWQAAVKLFDELLAASMSLEDVEKTLTMHDALSNAHISLDQVLELLISADSASVDKSELVQYHKDLKQQGLSIQDVAEVLGFKRELEKRGLGLDSLSPMVELTKSHGHPDEVIAAVAKYNSLTDIENQVVVRSQELCDLNERLASANAELERVKTKTSKLKGALQELHKVERMGFSEDVLRKLVALAGIHGTVKAVLEIVEAAANYLDITHRLKEGKAALIAKKAEIDKLEADYAHLKTVTTMCQNLMDRHNFGLDAVTMVFAAAEKYGQPVDMLKAIEAYGKIEAMEQKLRELEGKITAREERLSQLQGRVGEELEKLDSLHAMALKVGSSVAKVQQDVSRSQEYDRLIRFIEDPDSAGYEENMPLAVTMIVALRTWVIKHEKKFRYPHAIRGKLDTFLGELGGD